MYIHMYICMYIYIDICMCICIYIYVHPFFSPQLHPQVTTQSSRLPGIPGIPASRSSKSKLLDSSTYSSRLNGVAEGEIYGKSMGSSIKPWENHGQKETRDEE